MAYTGGDVLQHLEVGSEVGWRLVPAIMQLTNVLSSPLPPL